MNDNLTAVPGNFIDFDELNKRVPYSERHLRSLVMDGTIPSIRLNKGRKYLFDWGAVAQAIRSHSSNAA